MFLLTTDREAAQRALQRMRVALSERSKGAIALIPVGRFWLGWFASRPGDNLHIYEDAYVVGKVSLPEKPDPEPIRHPGMRPKSLHPLSAAVVIHRTGDIWVEPNTTTNVFYDGDSASDMQLLLAALKNRSPSPEGVAILASVGYFPGELTLIPRGFSNRSFSPILRWKRVATRSVAGFQGAQPDDAAMIERLTSIVPTSHRYLSRNLRRSRQSLCPRDFAASRASTVRLVRLADNEDDIALAIARDLRLSIEIVKNPAPRSEPVRVHNNDRCADLPPGWSLRTVKEDSHSWLSVSSRGSSLTPSSRTRFETAWKIPRFGRSLQRLLIEHALISRMRSEEPGLRSMRRRKEMGDHLYSRLQASEPDP